MDASPLLLAQTHARKASKANTPVAAIDEHEQAAGQFATAAKDTDNSEAFRTLKLLEHHHEKLSQLLKFQNSHPVTQPTEISSQAKPAQQPTPSQPPPPPTDVSPYRSKSKSLPAAHRPQRDISSSIASNLASARGIPSNRQRRSGQASSPVLAQHHAEGNILSPPRRSTLGDQSPTTTINHTSEKPQITFSSPLRTLPTTDIDPSSKKTSDPQPDLARIDEPFQRFFSTFESLFSKLSAPLAFAGLPLTTDEAPNTPRPKPSERATVEPDYSRLFSKAALRAVREEPGGGNLGAAESFYVVPTTGGTMPYASILARANHHAGLERGDAANSEDIEEFVDARETPGPPSPLVTRGKKRIPGKTMEELQLENEGLRTVLDDMSRRLFQFEMGAQMGSVALHQSIRASLRQSPAASVAGGVGDGEGKMNVLEEQVAAAKKEMERMGRENEKLKGVVVRYRERWEKLKEGARVRREGTGMGRDDGESIL